MLPMSNEMPNKDFMDTVKKDRDEKAKKNQTSPLTRKSEATDTKNTSPPPVAPQVLSRLNAAMYLGLSVRTFDEYVAMGMIPKIKYPGTLEKPSKSNGFNKPRLREGTRVSFWIRDLDHFLIAHTEGGVVGESKT